MSSPSFFPASSPVRSLGGKYVAVTLQREAYAIAVANVREIIRLPRITPLPQTPDYVRGVMNLRGKVIPVVDLRRRFGLQADFANRTCIVVVFVRVEEKELLVGLVVDTVEEVIFIGENDVEATPNLGASVDTSHLLGVAKVKGEVKMLLDVDWMASMQLGEGTLPEARAHAPEGLDAPEPPRALSCSKP